MKGFTIFLLICAGVIGYLVWSVNQPAASYRFRITIEVDTADGVKTGSSVLQVDAYKRFVPSDSGQTSSETTGEAVFVDLGGGRNLVALLALTPVPTFNGPKFFAPFAYLEQDRLIADDIGWARQMPTMRGRRPFAGRTMRPILATFSDLNDPLSVRRVPFDNPGSVFGHDVRGVQSWIEITRDPVTVALGSRIPWIRDFKSARAVWDRLGGTKLGASPLQLFKLRSE